MFVAAAEKLPSSVVATGQIVGAVVLTAVAVAAALHVTSVVASW